MTFTTIITPDTAVDRIIARGFNPLTFISRAYRDHSYEWAHEFEALAHINNCLGLAMTAYETTEHLSDDIDLELLVEVASRTPWICIAHKQWFIQLSEIVFSYTYIVSDIILEWGFDCDHNYEHSELFRTMKYHGSTMGQYHSCSIVRKLSLFDHQLNKGDLTGAINTAIVEADNAKAIAQEGIRNLNSQCQYLSQLAQSTLDRYPTL